MAIKGHPAVYDVLVVGIPRRRTSISPGLPSIRSSSQPALNRAIQGLEIELGGRLFHRERANTHLTELGRMVEPHLEQFAGAAQATKRAAKDFAQLERTVLKLGIMCTVAPDQIIELVGSIQTRHPGVELQLCDANAWELEQQLLDGRLEVAIYCLPGREPEERTHAMPLFRERMVVAIHPHHRLANGETISVRDLHGECYIHRMNCEFAGYADPIFSAQNVKCRAVYWSDRDDWNSRDGRRRSGLGIHARPFGEAPRGIGNSAGRPGILARGEARHGSGKTAFPGGGRPCA